MYKLCVFAGTADGRQLVERLAGQAEILACAATEYGGELLEEIPGVEVSAQRLDENRMEELFRQRQFDCVIDATHPYAPIVTENIRSACEKTGTSYLRLLRDGGLPEWCLFADSTAQAVDMLKTLPGNILLTTGSKELAAYAALPDYAQRVYARVLPVEASVAACRETGLPAAHIYAVQGPFPEELNVAMLHACNAQILVTKQTGSKGGFFEKVSAAQKAGVTLLVIGNSLLLLGLSLVFASPLARSLSLEQPYLPALIVLESFGMAMATYVGQNHGAGRTDRVRQGIRDGCIIQAGYSAIAWAAVFLVKRWAVGLVLGDAEPAIFNGAVEYLTVISVLFVLLGFLMIFRYTLQGLGYSVQAVISGVGELIGRALGGWLAVHQLGYFGICISNPLAWGFALCYCVFMVTRVLKKESRTA